MTLENNSDEKRKDGVESEYEKTVTEGAGTKSITEILKNVLNIAEDVFVKMSLDEVARIHSRKIDKYILKTAEEKGWVYRGGQFTILYVTNTVFSLEIALYYQDTLGEWKETKARTSRNMCCLKAESAQELMKKKKIVYDIEEPKK